MLCKSFSRNQPCPVFEKIHSIVKDRVECFDAINEFRHAFTALPALYASVRSSVHQDRAFFIDDLPASEQTALFNRYLNRDSMFHKLTLSVMCVVVILCILEIDKVVPMIVVKVVRMRVVGCVVGIVLRL